MAFSFNFHNIFRCFFSPKFQPLQIMHHFLTTTVYTFIPKYPQNKLLDLSIFLPGCSTHQFFSFSVLHTLLFSFHKKLLRLMYQILSLDIQILTWRFFAPLPILEMPGTGGHLYIFSGHGDLLEQNSCTGSMPLFTPNLSFLT